MNIKHIKSEADYQKALERVEEIFNAIPNTPQGDELENLTALIERYEAQHYCIDLPDL